jgi:hypothetical protein
MHAVVVCSNDMAALAAFANSSSTAVGGVTNSPWRTATDTVGVARTQCSAQALPTGHAETSLNSSIRLILCSPSYALLGPRTSDGAAGWAAATASLQRAFLATLRPLTARRELVCLGHSMPLSGRTQSEQLAGVGKSREAGSQRPGSVASRVVCAVCSGTAPCWRLVLQLPPHLTPSCARRLRRSATWVLPCQRWTCRQRGNVDHCIMVS